MVKTELETIRIRSNCKHRNHLSRCKLSLFQILVARIAEFHVVGLIVRQQVGLKRRVRLVASQAIHWSQNLARSRRIHQVGNRVTGHGMPQAKFQWQHPTLFFEK